MARAEFNLRQYREGAGCSRRVSGGSIECDRDTRSDRVFCGEPARVALGIRRVAPASMLPGG
jgi:hypothetical protein